MTVSLAEKIGYEFRRRVRERQAEFLDIIEPARADLYRYCRSLA